MHDSWLIFSPSRSRTGVYIHHGLDDHFHVRSFRKEAGSRYPLRCRAHHPSWGMHWTSGMRGITSQDVYPSPEKHHTCRDFMSAPDLNLVPTPSLLSKVLLCGAGPELVLECQALLSCCANNTAFLASISSKNNDLYHPIHYTNPKHFSIPSDVR